MTIGGCQRILHHHLHLFLVYLRSFSWFHLRGSRFSEENREPEQDEIWWPSRTFCRVTESTLASIFCFVVLFGYPLPWMWWCWPFTADGNLRDSLSLGQTLKAKSASPFSSLFSTCEEPSGPPVASGRETLAWLIRHREGRTRNRLLQPTPERCVSVSTGFKHATDTPADISGNIYSK